ncbi:ESPR-type extended signal peptide-containing protein [Dialister succinatiphilus]|uniref:ESPR-type extended signal peptide-containing protein n=1 Tax=Dialister succinatiphilus TaxID=487173 RepID=UPI00235424B3|nr:ESPR-type extended signal peptide-containing protein [Dialister succinatiphilus]MCI6029920.1 YadA-like family protein [Dialister succinatiphilus]
MNRVYKVIWSKAKHCYVVTSEIARSVTKSASSARSAGRKGAAVLAMAALLFTAGGVLGEAANFVTDVKYGKTADVIMVTKDDGTTTPITITDVDRAIKANSDGDGLIIKENYVKNADARVSTDGEYVKKDKKVGENLSALDAQVKKNTLAVAGVIEAGEKVGEKLLDLDKQDKVNADAVAAEATARKAADTKEAAARKAADTKEAAARKAADTKEAAARKQADQGNLKIGTNDEILKVKDDGTEAVKKLVLNKDGENQITLSDGFYAGAGDYANASAALKSDGSIKGASGKFTVDGTTGDISGTNITGDNVTVNKKLTTEDLAVNGTSTLTGDVTMESNATVGNDLAVNGESTFNNKVTITKGGLDVTGRTTTDTLHVNGGGYVGGDLKVDGNIETHDAVLSADSRQVVTGRQLYQTNERVDRLDNRIKKVGANAAALAALRPGDFNPDDKFSIAAGFGSYRNANAAALGLFYRPNENVLLSLGTSFGDGENMVNAGVSVKFGRGKSMAERRKEMADEVSSMRDEMRSQDERIAELEEMLKKQSELIEKLSKES